MSGHRLATADVESAILLTGQAIVAYVTLTGDLEGCAEMEDEIREHVAGRSLGPSRSSGPTTCRNPLGKILRRLLRDPAEGRALGD